jgi:hypothetical protein
MKKINYEKRLNDIQLRIQEIEKMDQANKKVRNEIREEIKEFRAFLQEQERKGLVLQWVPDVA